jgi:hypothetical protein
MGQVYPGSPIYSNDTAEKRVNYFKSGLEKITWIKNVKCLAFPYFIGCGLAGGDWKVYSKILEEFSENNKNIEVVLYKI